MINRILKIEEFLIISSLGDNYFTSWSHLEIEKIHTCTKFLVKLTTVFPHIVAAPRQLFFFNFEFIKACKFHIVSSLSFLLYNENLNSFLT